MSNKRVIALAFTLAGLLFIFSWLLSTMAMAVFFAIGLHPLHIYLTGKLSPSLKNDAAAISLLIIMGTIALLLIWAGAYLGSSIYEQAQNLIAIDNIQFKIESLIDDLMKDWPAKAAGAKQLLVKTKAALIAGDYTRKVDAFTLLAEGTYWSKWTLTLGIQTLFFLFFLFHLLKSGPTLARQITADACLIFGPDTARRIEQQTTLFRSIFNGAIILGLAEAALFIAAFGAIDLPNYALLGISIGVASIIPFVSSIILAGVGIYLAATGSLAASFFIALFGGTILLILDPIARPMLSRNSGVKPAALLLGMLGGLQAFGASGIFLGPAILLCAAQLHEDLNLKRNSTTDSEAQVDRMNEK